jgi:hypothetical protein
VLRSFLRAVADGSPDLVLTEDNPAYLDDHATFQPLDVRGFPRPEA